MRIDVITIFPDMVEQFASESLLGRARRTGLLDVRVHDLRDATTDAHRTVDDTPFGGGAGMVLMPEPIFATVERVDPPRPLFLLGPGGRTFDQAMARELAATAGLLAALRSLRGRRRAGARAPRRRRALDRRLRARRRRGGGHGGARGRRAARAGRDGQRRLGGGRVVHRRPARVPAVHQAGRVPGLAVPEVLRSGDHGRVARWRRARPCVARMAAART